MHKNNSFIESFLYAMDGFVIAIQRERNLRVHISMANLIFFFAYVYGLTRTEWAILTIIVGLVIAIELVNTAIENAVNTATKRYNVFAKMSKDTAAAAVLVISFVALLVGLFLFLDIDKIIITLQEILHNPLYLFIGIFLVCIDTLFLIFGGKIRRMRK